MNERRRKTFVILLLMYLYFNEHKTVHVLPVSNTNCNELVFVNLIACFCAIVCF